MDKSSSNSASSPEQKIESKTMNNPPEEVVIQPKEISQSPIINISDNEDLSSIETLFITSKDEPNQDLPVSNSIEHKNEMIPRTRHFKKHPERENKIEKKREHELAFSATCPEEIMKVKKSKRSKSNKNKPRNKVSSSQEQQKCIQKYLDQEQTMWEVQNHHKTILDYAKFITKNDFIDTCRNNEQNMVNINYSRIIKRELPRLHCTQYPISRKLLIQEFQEKVYELSPPEWGEYSKNRGDELKRLENTIVFNQLLKNNFLHAWKYIYQDVNDLCNEFKVPNHRRIEFYRKELEYLSLYIHDVLPLNYNEQGIHPNDPSISKYTKFFSKNDSLLEARKKWHDFILQDYDYFWDVYSNKINYRTLTDSEIVKLQDIYDIVYFIYLDGIQTLLNTPDTHTIIIYVYQIYIKLKNWVSTRHYSYYVWLLY